MNTAGFIITILLATFTGWILTWAATKMLFHPINPIRFFGITIQGIFPKNQQLIAEKLGQAVSREFLSFTQIEEKITDPENLQKIKPDIEAHIDNFLRHKLKEVFPMLAMMMGEKTILQLKEAFLAELELLFPLIMKSYMNKLQHDLDLEKIVTQKIAGFSSKKLEGLLSPITKKKYRQLQLTGLIFGFMIGIVQVLVAFLTQK